jgi:hypothetical protein
MTALLVAAVVLLAAPVARAAKPLATVSVSPVGLDWQTAGDYEKLTLTVSGPGGLILHREFRAGVSALFEFFGDDGKPLPDGAYTYELIAAPRLDAETRQALAAARRAGDDAAIAKLQTSGRLPRGPLAQSGTFTIQNGAVVSPELREPPAPRGPKAPANKGLTSITPKDVVTPDDSIIQGSLCVGLDCVNNESFGFDTIRLKENNTRIKFDDTSTGTGFPNHDWQLTANDSASGGANKFSIEDITAATVPFTVTGSAPTNSIFVDSTGRLGLRTSTPVLDLHIATSNTPAIRLEQNSSGGFTAQTWDVAGNEANFFVRDVTGGSRLPFRIRPGAPTSSIDINASGNVGIGTASPNDKLHIELDASGKAGITVRNSNATGFSGIEAFDEAGVSSFFLGADNANNNTRFNSLNNFPIVFFLNGTEKLRFPTSGNVITAANGAFLSSGGTWTSVSSRESKRDIAELSDSDALKTLEGLNPVTFRYKAEPEEQYVGFVAEDVPDLVATNDHKHLNPMDVVAVLTKVVQEQQKKIAELSARLADLEQEKK